MRGHDQAYKLHVWALSLPLTQHVGASPQTLSLLFPSDMLLQLRVT